MTELILYDTPTKNPALKSWSPMVWITRFALNYKGIKYRTEWVEFPDIESVCKKIGAEPTGKKRDGVTPHYTVPVIYDPSTQAVISDSSKIADYLEKTYPDTPVLFPLGTHGLIAAFTEALRGAAGGSLHHLCLLPSVLNMNKVSAEYYRTTREVYFGMKLEEIAPEGEVSEKYWTQLEGGLAKIAGWFKANEDKPFIGGDTLCYADCILAAKFMEAKVVWGEDSKNWKRLADLDSGRWGRYLGRFDKYAAIP